MTLFRSAGSAAAENTVSGEVSVYATWAEDIYFFEPDGDAMDISEMDFYLQFRTDPADKGAAVTLSTDAGTLSIVADGGGTESILRIHVDAGTLAAYEGDYICDLIAVDTSDDITHYAHGVVTFRNDPVAV